MLPKLWAEVVVAAFALDRFNENTSDINVIPLQHLGQLAERSLLELHGHSEVLSFTRESHLGVLDTGPGEKRIVLEFPGVSSVGAREGVSSATMEGFTEVDDLMAPLAKPPRQVLPHLPIHRRLNIIVRKCTRLHGKEDSSRSYFHSILHALSASLDEEDVLELWWHGDSR